jgi:hypothetical protein
MWYVQMTMIRARDIFSNDIFIATKDGEKKVRFSYNIIHVNKYDVAKNDPPRPVNEGGKLQPPVPPRVT